MSDSLFSVEDQVVLVSGGSRGIGKAIAAGFAQRNAKVIVTGRSEAVLAETCSEISTGTHPVRPYVCDVADTAAIHRMSDELLGEYGHIETLINVAGVNRRKPTESISEDDYDFIMDINLKGAFLLSQRIGTAMMSRGQGSQINIASLNSDRPLTQVIPYAMSKAGIAQMTKALALEWGDRGVRVNALAPGFVLTELTQKLWSNPDMQEWGKANTPQRRLGKPEDMVGTAIFLASEASAFMTGQVLYVDGGFTAGWAWPIPPNNQ